MSLPTNVHLDDVTIPNGTGVSNIVRSHESYDDAISISLYGPSSLDAQTFTLEVSPDPQVTAAGPWYTLQEDTPTDVGPPLVSKSRTYYNLPTHAAWRIKSSGNVAAARTWKASKNAASTG